MSLRNAVKLFASLFIPQFVGAVGGLVTAPAIRTWYPVLEKPPLMPPAWLFSPVWVTLYLLMGIALYLIWREQSVTATHTQALRFFSIQLALNAMWSPLFFGWQAIGTAAIVIVFLWFFILATIITFWRQSRTAAILLVPYLAWTSFATYLNIAFYFLNR